ncbi:hypothetical protein O6P43_002095 [Quillaja saponaria]|uniref:Uncharacterized protein n=1 Tax=Quillaja saponaria TaxID=32244 RepID=A0AAD7QBR6_QUISA|nr:hypothetical protein O6P43_002095 [Quillaja saponaria]
MKWVLTSANPLANLNFPLPPTTATSLVGSVTGFLDNTLMELPLKLPVGLFSEDRRRRIGNQMGLMHISKDGVIRFCHQQGGGVFSGKNVKEVEFKIGHLLLQLRYWFAL